MNQMSAVTVTVVTLLSIIMTTISYPGNGTHDATSIVAQENQPIVPNARLLMKELETKTSLKDVIAKINELIRYLNKESSKDSIEIIRKASGYAIVSSDGEDDFVREEEYEMENDHNDTYSEAKACHDLLTIVKERFFSLYEEDLYDCKIEIVKKSN